MITYVRLGIQNYVRTPVPTTPVNSRSAWEFVACLSGSMKAWMPDADHDEVLRQSTFWVFPRLHPHGWLSDAPCERAVFQFSEVPAELGRLVPPRGYYRVHLSPDDCTRIRSLAKTVQLLVEHPTELHRLQESTLSGELSLIALREIQVRSLSGIELASRKTDQALGWYTTHMSERPRFQDIARAVTVSPAYLRRLFHKATGESPQTAFNRLRMELAHKLLLERRFTLETISDRVGFTSASALSRAMKAHFGLTPRQLRTGITFHRLVQ